MAKSKEAKNREFSQQGSYEQTFFRTYCTPLICNNLTPLGPGTSLHLKHCNSGRIFKSSLHLESKPAMINTLFAADQFSGK